MFDRFDERARRVILFARREARRLGSDVIETEHILLALLKEDRILRPHLPADAPEFIRQQIEQVRNASTSPSPDLRLSRDSERALACCAEEAEQLNHQRIGPSHITLGLLRFENCAAATLLRYYGINPERYRVLVREALAEATVSTGAGETDTVAELENLVGRTRKHLKRYADVYGEQPLPDKPWTRKQALGHLVDWAAVHQIWFARALTESKLVALGYPLDSWVAAQKYGNYVWQEIVDLWTSLNLLLIHVLELIPEGKLSLECRIGADEPIPLSKLVQRYVEHCEELTAQILA